MKLGHLVFNSLVTLLRKKTRSCQNKTSDLYNDICSPSKLEMMIECR